MSLVWSDDDSDSLCMDASEKSHEVEAEIVACDSCGDDAGPFRLIEDESVLNRSVGYGETLLICRRCLEGA